MKIITFEVQKLHGFLDVTIPFNDDLTIIVGRNGSGKTSSLSLISDMLRLDVLAIRKVPFREAALYLDDPSLGKIIVRAQNDDQGKLISVERDLKTASLPLDLPDELYPQGISGAKASFLFQGLLNLSHPQEGKDGSRKFDSKDWLNSARALADATKLIFVKLDRTVVTVDPNGIERIEMPRARGGKVAPIDPIDEVLRVTTQKYGEFKKKVEEIKSIAFNELLELHFEPVSEIHPRRKTPPSQLKTKLNQLKRRVESSALLNDSSSLKSTAQRFFESFSNLLFEPPSSSSDKKRAGRKTLQDESARILLNLKEAQLEKLFTIFQKEQDETQQAYETIDRYLKSAMRFLNESGKNLEFDTSLQLGFTVPSAVNLDKNEGRRIRGLKELSSGERQIIIVLTYLAFLAGENSIFIVDEPELSLHLRWQGYLVTALNNLRPQNCQIVIATHAPEIVGESRSKIQLLKPTYLPTEEG